MKIISVEVFCGRRIAEDQVESFQDQKLQRGLRFSIQKKDQVAPKGLICCSVSGYCLNDAVCSGTMSIRLSCGSNKILFVQYQLSVMLTTSRIRRFAVAYQNTDYGIMIGIFGVIGDTL